MKSLSKFILLPLLFCAILAGLAQPASVEASIARVDSGPKMISVSIASNIINGFYWQPGANINVTIDDPAIPGSPDFTDVAVWEPMWSDYVVRLEDRFTLRPGQTVTMTDGSITKVLLIIPLEVTRVDLTADTVSGQTIPFQSVEVGIGNDSSIQRTAHPGKDGLWTVDFSKPGPTPSEQKTFDITKGTSGSAVVYDQDFDAVSVSWLDSNIEVWPGENQVKGFDWLLGAYITLKIDDPHTPDNPDYMATQPVFAGDPGIPGQTLVDFRLGSSYDIQPGDIVSLTDGMVAKSITVADLAITRFNIGQDTVSGRALPGSQVDVWAFDGTNYSRHVTADRDGKWLADFSRPGSENDEQTTHDLVPGTWIELQQADADGNLTRYSLAATDAVAVIEVFVSNGVLAADWHFQNQVYGTNFPLGASVTMTLDKTPGDRIVDHTETKTVEPADWSPNATSVGFDLSAFTLLPGQVVTLSTMGITKTHTITALEVTGYRLASDTVWGTAARGTQVNIHACNKNDCTDRSPTADGAGNWTADFGNAAQDQPAFDIRPGSVIDVYQRDDEGNYTDYRFAAPILNFRVLLDRNSVEALDWGMSATVRLNINDPHTPENPDYTTTQQVVKAPDLVPAVTYLNFSIGAGYTLKPGDEVTLIDGMLTRTTIVTSLAFTSLDLNTDTVRGMARPYAPIGVSACDNLSCATRHVEADKDGAWVAGFGSPGKADDEQATLNIVSGGWVEAWQADAYDTRTMIRMDVLLPERSPIRAQANPAKVGQEVTASITFTKPENAAGDTLLWEWGDGTTTEDLHPTLPIVTATHKYTQPGIYTLTATIHSSSRLVSETERYDGLVVTGASVGIVQGDGWFDSPGGASPTTPALGDRASFWFINAFPSFLNAPIGLILFKAGNLSFVSTSYDWLVVSASKMQLKGQGTINGMGSYTFLLNAVDAPAGAGADLIRIKIWNSSTGQVVYDSQPGAGDSAPPNTTLGGGFILIQ